MIALNNQDNEPQPSLKRLKIEDLKTDKSFFIYTPITADDLNDPIKARSIIEPILNGKSIELFDVYFGDTWITSSEL